MSDYLSQIIDYTQEGFLETYDELPLWSAMSGLLLLRHVPLGRGWQVLDLGCGAGFPLLELAQRLGASAHVIGADPWQAALERAAQKARAWGVTNVELRNEDGARLSFPDATFDLIVSNLGINNFEDPPAALRECRRVLKPDGRLALATNLQGHMAEFYAAYEQTLRALDQPIWLSRLRDHVRHRVTVASLRGLLEAAGFELRRVEQETQVLRFLDGSALLRHAFIRLGFLEAWKEIIPEEAQAGVFSRLEADLNELARRQGELRLTVPFAYLEASAARSEE